MARAQISVASTSTFLKGGALRRAAPSPAQARRVPNRCGARCLFSGKAARHGVKWWQDRRHGRARLYLGRSDL